MQSEVSVFYTVYKVTNKTNNKFYIGKHQTKNHYARLAQRQ